MKKSNIILIALAVILAGQAFYHAWAAGRTYAWAVVPTYDPDVICARRVITDLVSVDLEVTEGTPINEDRNGYNLTVELNNMTNIQYRYQVTIACDNALIYDSEQTKILYAENYSNGSHHNATTVHHFMADSKYSLDHREVGSLRYTLRQVKPAPATGYIQVEVAVYMPLIDRRVATVTQQLEVDILQNQASIAG